jgi:hypothetical protein
MLHILQLVFFLQLLRNRTMRRLEDVGYLVTASFGLLGGVVTRQRTCVAVRLTAIPSDYRVTRGDFCSGSHPVYCSLALLRPKSGDR